MIGTAHQKFQIGLYSVSVALATIAIGCRFWARTITRTRLQFNDYLMVLSYLNVVGLVVAANLVVIDGELGVHQSEIPRTLFTKVFPINMKMIVIIPALLISAAFAMKMSITHFYIILFPHTWLKRVCEIQLYLMTICWIATIVPCFLICQPLSILWDPTISLTAKEEKCLNIKGFWLGTSIIALGFDLTCVFLPIPVVWRLRTNIGKKIKLTVLFGLGLLICIITALRIYYDERIDFNDLTWSAAPAVICTVTEPALGIVAGCLPIAAPLLSRATSTIKSTFSSRSRTLTTDQSNPSGGKSSLRHLSETNKFRRLHDHLYPMSPTHGHSVSASAGTSAGFSPLAETPAEETMRHGEEEGEEMRNFAAWSGITVLSEVHIDSERRQEIEACGGVDDAHRYGTRMHDR